MTNRLLGVMAYTLRYKETAHGRLASVRKYSYWPDRRIRDIAADNGMDLERLWNFSFRTPMLTLFPQAEFVRHAPTLIASIRDLE